MRPKKINYGKCDEGAFADTNHKEAQPTNTKSGTKTAKVPLATLLRSEDRTGSKGRTPAQLKESFTALRACAHDA